MDKKPDVARRRYEALLAKEPKNEQALLGFAGFVQSVGGDPNVNPFRANQADVSLEWYHGRNDILTGALFYKDIQSFIIDRPVQEPFLIQTDNPNLSLCTPAFTTEFPNRYNCQFTINQRSNGGGGKVRGAEVALLPPVSGGRD